MSNRRILVAAGTITFALANACAHDLKPDKAGNAVDADKAEPSNPEIDAALAAARSGAVDQAMAKLRRIAAQLEATNPRDAAKAHLHLAEFHGQQGQTTAALNEGLAAIRVGAGTDLEAMATYVVDTNFAQLSIEKGALGAAWLCLDDADRQLPGMRKADQNGNASAVLGQRTVILVHAVELFERGEPASADLPRDLQILLIALFEGQAAVPADHSASVSPATLARVDARRPWRPKLLDEALQLTDQMMARDAKRPGEVGEIEIAKDQSFKAELLEMSGRTDAEVEGIRRKALATFARHKIATDALIELDRIVELQMKRQTPADLVAAFGTSSQLMGLAEGEMQWMVGETAAQFEQRWRGQYARHLLFLETQHETFSQMGDAKQTLRALEALLLQVDRWSFRPLRQELALYQRMQLAPKSASGGASDGLIEDSWSGVLRAKEEVTQAQEAGKLPEDFGQPGKIEVDSPFGHLRLAKAQMARALEDRMRLDKGNAAFKDGSQPGTLEALQAHLGLGRAVIAYWWNPSNGAMRAAVIEASQVHVVPLGTISAEEVRELGDQLTKGLAKQNAKADAAVQALSKLLVHPLGALPEHLVIVLSPELLGLPFETLEDSAGQSLVRKHDILYSIGLSKSLATTLSLDVKSGFVVGAEKSRLRSLPALEASAVEVKGIRSLLASAGAGVAPAEALPATPVPDFERGGNFDVVHVSSHAVLDGDTPILDALAFPETEVRAFDLSHAQLRAKLSVLSACALFMPRKDGVSPVSGITTAFLAKVAPYVISPLWPVNGEATSVFMVRYYEELGHSKDPTAALAATKRAFLAPKALKKWAQAHHLPLSVPTDELARPVYWAPFVETFVAAAEPVGH